MVTLTRTNERRVEMERLTHKARYEAGYKLNKGVKEWQAADRLGAYENTGLTPPEIMELAERDTARAPEEIQDAFGDTRLICPNCRNSVINYFNRSRPPRFCMICGQRLKFGE